MVITESKQLESNLKDYKKNYKVLDINLFNLMVDNLGNSIHLLLDSIDLYNTDQLKSIKQSFLIEKLNIPDNESLDFNFEKLTNEFIQLGYPSKRALFYYFIVKYFGKEKLFARNHSDELIQFGENFIKNQKDLDRDISLVIDRNFFDLL